MNKSVSNESGLNYSLNTLFSDQNEAHISSSLPKKSFKEKVLYVLKHLTVEPLFFFYIVPGSVAMLAAQNLVLEKACRVNLKMNSTICDALSARNKSAYNETDEMIVQKEVTSMNVWKTIINSLLPMVMILFLGSYSDKNKRRKICIQLPLVGDFLMVMGFLICTFFSQLPMEWTAVAESVLPSLLGSWFTFYMGVYSYVSVVSSEETRTLRIGAANIVDKVSFTFGMAISGIALRLLNFYGVFISSLAVYLLGLTYCMFYLKEVPRDQVSDDKKGNFFKEFFNIKHLVDTVKVAFKDGEHNRKKRVLAIMVLVMVITGPDNGEYAVLYMFVRHKFGWNEIDFSLFSTFYAVAQMIGTSLSLMVFSKYLKLNDTILGMISNCSKILAGLVYAFAPTTIYFYIGAIIEMFNVTSFVAMRSIISKLVAPDELGQINSLFGVCEALTPLIYGPLYSVTYKMTIGWLPGFFYLVGGILTIPSVIIFFWLYTEIKKDEQEQQNQLKNKLNIEENQPLNSTVDNNK